MKKVLIGAGAVILLAVAGVVVEGERVEMDLVFTSPWECQATTGYALTQVDGGTQVLWLYDQDADFGTKMMTLFMETDTMLGPDFEQGLTSLTALGEQARSDREAAEQAAQDQAAADAADTEGDAPAETR